MYCCHPEKGAIGGKVRHDGLKVQITKQTHRLANADLRVGSRHLHPDAYLQGHCQTAQFAKSLVLRMLTARFCSGLLYLLLFSRQRLSNTLDVAEFAGVWSQPKASLRWLARGCCSGAGDGLCAEMGMGSDAVGHPRGQAGSLGGVSWGKRETG